MLDEEKTLKKEPSNNYFKKFWIIFACVLVLLIPLQFLKGLIEDREYHRNVALTSIKNAWADEQVIARPNLVLKNGKNQFFLDLNTYNVNINIDTQIRNKGIFKVPVYTANVEINGDFINKDFHQKTANAEISFGVKDTKGFIEEPQFKIYDGPYIPVGERAERKNIPVSKQIPFSIKYKLRGMNSIAVQPSGKTNNITMKGTWTNPNFVGEFLPLNKSIDKKGFEATWKIPKISGSDAEANCGVMLYLPVDSYRMATRAIKYGFLFLSLTFLSFFVFEITSKDKRKIHPLQYLLMGLAMCVFYLLLVSVSEFLSFGIAYLIAALMTVLLIGIYSYGVITKKQNTNFPILISTIIALLYAFLYVLLVLQDFSLLLGSLGTFVIIALIMYATKDIEWYNEEK